MSLLYSDTKSLANRAALVLAAGLLLCIAFAGFSTKGEPREALVAVEMLRSGNWILPTDLSGDMAYKPPLFHWLIALFSLPAGHVTELTARLPSALAGWLLFMFSARFFAVKSNKAGLLSAIFAITCFEVFRAATVCRVDMLLTMLITGAMMALFNASRTGRRSAGWYIAAILAMSGATLTKGPVGIILPSGCFWLYRLLRGDNFWRTSFITLGLIISSAILPFMWYSAAYKQGGERFLTLAVEENFGRFTGSMSYDSHIKPFWYNITSLLLGTLPWIIGVITFIFIAERKRKLSSVSLKGWWSRLRTSDNIALYSLVCAIIVFIFYSIPQSKRSVYLLPMYPFIGYGFALYARKLVQAGRLSIKALRRSVGIVGLLYLIGFGIVFPIIASRKSDRTKSEEIAALIPSGPIYSYIPDRFMRFFITDFYLGGRLQSLLPSQQVKANTELPPDSRSMKPLPSTDFYLITAQEFLEKPSPIGLGDWFRENNLEADTIYTSSSKAHDIKSKIIILHIRCRQSAQQ